MDRGEGIEADPSGDTVQLADHPLDLDEVAHWGMIQGHRDIANEPLFSVLFIANDDLEAQAFEDGGRRSAV
jgi:hypothetical protein